MTLYEIDEQILGCVDSETGEIIDEEKLAELNIAFDEKVENIALWIKNLLSEAEAIKQEKLKLGDRQKAAENKAESLKKYLQTLWTVENLKQQECRSDGEKVRK